MPPVRYPTGSGSTASLPAQANAGRVNGTKNTSPDSPWTYRAPASTMYADIAAANARNAFLIRQAQRRAEIMAQQRRLEEERLRREADARQRLQEQTRAANRTPDVPEPGRYDESGRPIPFDQPGPGVYAPLPPEQQQTETPGAFSGLFSRSMALSQARISSARTDAVKRIMEGTYDSISKAKQLGSPTIYEEIAMLEETYDQRVAQAAVEIWGRPRELTYYNPETGQVEFGGWDWSYTDQGAPGVEPGSVEYWRRQMGGGGTTDVSMGAEGGYGRPVEYLGLDRGAVPQARPTPPAEDAPYSEWAAYRNQLQQSIRKPMYRPESVMETLWAMGPDGVKQMQKQALKAQWYDSNDVVKFGVIGPKEVSWMEDLMALGNMNGTTWEEQFSMEIQGSLEAAARASSGGGGYGGGGGGGGTTVYKQIQYTQTSMAQARSLLVGILTEALGREPTDSEVSKFVAMLNKAESKSPSRNVTKTTTEGDMTTAVSRTTPSSVDPEMLAREFAQDIGGGKPYEANAQARYLSALLESLGSASV